MRQFLYAVESLLVTIGLKTIAGKLYRLRYHYHLLYEEEMTDDCIIEGCPGRIPWGSHFEHDCPVCGSAQWECIGCGIIGDCRCT